MDQNDFETRKKGFIEEYGKIVEKYQCDIYAFPMYMPMNEGTMPTFRTVLGQDIVDKATAPKDTSFMAHENTKKN